MNENALNAAMDAAMKRNNSGKSKITQEEAQNFKKAFAKPEFRDMFNEYLKEISDPKNRAEHEAYIEQLETEKKVPKNMKLVKPTAGFCVKVKTDDEKQRKVFINVCHSQDVERATAKSVTQDGKRGQSWTLPHIVSPQRVERDAKGQPSETFDVCFHTDALLRCDNPAFKDLLARTAIDAVQKAVIKVRKTPDFKLNAKYHILKKTVCVGGKPSILNVPRKDKAETTQESKRDEGADKKSKKVAKKNTKPAVKKGFLNSKSSSKKKKSKAKPKFEPPPASKVAGQRSKPLITEISSSRVPKPSGPATPKYTITHRGFLEMQNFLSGRNAQRYANRPKELVIAIELPALISARSVDLDVSDDRLQLFTMKKIYELDLKLPYPVHGAKGKAKFLKKTRTLRVTVPVQPPPKPTKESEQKTDTPAPATVSDPATADESTTVADGQVTANQTEEAVPETTSATSASSNKDTASAPVTGKPSAPKHDQWVKPVDPEQASASRALAEDIKRRAALAKKEAELALEGTATNKAENPAPETPDAPADVEQTSDQPEAPKASISGDFVASKSFTGSQPGYVFQMGDKGLGYYRDTYGQTKTDAAVVAPVPKLPDVKMRQSLASATLLVNVANVDESKSSIDFQESSVVFSLVADGTTSKFAIQLSGNILAEKCRFNVSSKNVAIVVHKETPSLWDTVGSVEFVSEKSDDAAETAAPDAETDVASPSTPEPEAEKTEATADATNIDRTLLMFQNSHLFELD